MPKGWVYNLDGKELKSREYTEPVLCVKQIKLINGYQGRGTGLVLTLQLKITMKIFWALIF